jgi:hypothetical protein
MSGATTFDFRFLKQIAVTLAAVTLLGSYPLLTYAGQEIVTGVLAGVGMSVVNVLMGYAAVEYSFHRSYTTFMQIVLGGIVLRLFVMAGLLVLLILAFRVHSVALVSSLFVMYIIFLALEVLYIHNKWQDKIKSS